MVAKGSVGGDRRGGRWEKWKQGVKRDKLTVIRKFWDCSVQNDNDSQQFCIVHLKVVERIDLKSYHKKKIYICVRRQILTRLTMVIILQYIQISNHLCTQLTLILCYMSVASQ